jgi:hypothetical protein
MQPQRWQYSGGRSVSWREPWVSWAVRRGSYQPRCCVRWLVRPLSPRPSLARPPAGPDVSSAGLVPPCPLGLAGSGRGLSPPRLCWGVRFSGRCCGGAGGEGVCRARVPEGYHLLVTTKVRNRTAAARAIKPPARKRGVANGGQKAVCACRWASAAAVRSGPGTSASCHIRPWQR